MASMKTTMSATLSPLESLDDLANVAKTLGHAHRLALLEAIFKRESSVEQLAEDAGLSITNASQHLKQLRQVGLIQSRRDGKQVLYRVGSGPVANLLAALRDYVSHQQADMQRIISDSIQRPEQLEGVSIEQLLEKLENGALLLDVRSHQDYESGHIPGAINIPTEELDQHLAQLPRNQEILAYCGGRYCVLSIEAVAWLRAQGFQADRVYDGFPGWWAAGMRVETIRH